MTKLLTVLNIFPRAAEISKLYFCDPDQHLTQIPHEQWTVVHLKLIQMSSFLVQLKFRIAIFSVILMTSHESPVEKWLEFKTTNYKCLGWPQKWRWGREIGGRQGGQKPAALWDNLFRDTSSSCPSLAATYTAMHASNCLCIVNQSLWPDPEVESVQRAATEFFWTMCQSSDTAASLGASCKTL